MTHLELTYIDLIFNLSGYKRSYKLVRVISTLDGIRIMCLEKSQLDVAVVALDFSFNILLFHGLKTNSFIFFTSIKFYFTVNSD